MANAERRLQAAARQKQALKLRLAGASYEDIATQLGYAGRGNAWRSVMAALKATLQEPADQVRILEAARLDRLLLGVWTQAAKGNQGAIDRAIKIMERRAKLLGLDAPSKQQIEAVGDTVIKMTWGEPVDPTREGATEPVQRAVESGDQ